MTPTPSSSSSFPNRDHPSTGLSRPDKDSFKRQQQQQPASSINQPSATSNSLSSPTSTLSKPTVNPSDLQSTDEDHSDTESVQSRHTLRTLNGDSKSKVTPSLPVEMDSDEELAWNDQREFRAIETTPDMGSMEADGVTFGDGVLTSKQKRRIIYKAVLKLLILFLVCAVGLGGTLYFALPEIDEQAPFWYENSPPDFNALSIREGEISAWNCADRASLKIPKSFDDLQALNAILQHYKDEHFARVMLCWVIVYMFLQAFSIPGSMYMSILAGAMWGVWLALPIVCASVATGATICYLISAYLGEVLVALPKWKARVDSWKVKMKEHDDDMLSYLVVLRMMPLPPHNIVNILSPHLGISIPIFWSSTFFGIFAVSVIHTTIGEKLDDMSSASDFNLMSFRNFLLLAFVCVAVMIPVLVKRFKKVEPLEESLDSEGRVRLEGEEDRINARSGLIGRSRSDAYDDDDEEDSLPRIRIHGNPNLDDSENESERGSSAWRNQAEVEASSRNGNGSGWSDEEGPNGRGFSDRREHNGPKPGSKAARILGSNEESTSASTKLINKAQDLWGWAAGSTSNQSSGGRDRRVRI